MKENLLPNDILKYYLSKNALHLTDNEEKEYTVIPVLSFLF